MELIGGSYSLLLVVVFCSNNELVVANCGVLRAIVELVFGHWFMVPIFIFNINSSKHCLTFASALLLTPYFSSTEWVGVFQRWSSPTFVHTKYESRIGICLVRVIGSCNPQFSYSSLTHVVLGHVH